MLNICGRVRKRYRSDVNEGRKGTETRNNFKHPSVIYKRRPPLLFQHFTDWITYITLAFSHLSPLPLLFSFLSLSLSLSLPLSFYHTTRQRRNSLIKRTTHKCNFYSHCKCVFPFCIDPKVLHSLLCNTSLRKKERRKEGRKEWISGSGIK